MWMLSLQVLLVALPHSRFLQIHDMLGVAVRAVNTIRPTQRDHERFAVRIAAEELDRLLKSGRDADDQSMPHLAWSVMYITAF